MDFLARWLAGSLSYLRLLRTLRLELPLHLTT